MVGAGLLVAGLSAYGFLALSARTLSKAEVAPLSATWALVFLLGPGLFLPLEQEVSRALAGRRVQGLGGAPVLRRAATVGIGLGLGVLVILIATARLTVDRLFDHQLLLLVGLSLGLAGALAGHLTRGCLSGTAHFKGYGTYLGADGLIRFLGCVVCVVVGVETAGWFGIAVGIAGLLAVPVALRVERPRLGAGPEAAWAEISQALFYLLAASLFAWTIMNIGPVLVNWLATDAERDLAGQFLQGLVVARIPLFLFQAIQAALLPKLSGLATAGRIVDFRNGLRRLLIVVAGLAVAGTIGGALLGPFAVQVMSGPKYDLSHRTMGMLAAGSGLYMLALAIAQALIALGGHRRQAFGWGMGLLALLVTVWLASDDLYLRVEIGLLVGSLVALVVMSGLLVRRVREAGPGGLDVEPGDLIEALHDVPAGP
ncbi:MAG: lipopolysaccharide biosynthesis protein [Acidimicrobiales bacterium]